MTFSKRWEPKPPLPKCKQCGKKPQIAGRKDGRCENCAGYVDANRAERQRNANK